MIGQGGRLRSVILTGDSNAVEVLNGSSLVAKQTDDSPVLQLEKGSTRIERASSGDGSPTRLAILDRNSKELSRDSSGERELRSGTDPEPAQRVRLSSVSQIGNSSNQPSFHPRRNTVTAQQGNGSRRPNFHRYSASARWRHRHYRQVGHPAGHSPSTMPAPTYTISVHRISFNDPKCQSFPFKTKIGTANFVGIRSGTAERVGSPLTDSSYFNYGQRCPACRVRYVSEC